jgi:hypothetical protein
MGWFSEGIDDIRHKYEEVMYGRQVTGDIKEVEAKDQSLAEPEQEPMTMADFYGDPHHDDPSYSLGETPEQDRTIDNDIER